MSAGFGFSVGDIVAGLKLIKQSIEAIQDTKGSTADFEALGHEIASLKAGLEAVEDLKLDQTFGSESKQCVAIGQAIARCWKCIDIFLSTIAKYQPWLRSKAASASLNWKANLKKIQWALCKKDDVNRFRAQLERHTSSISMLLVTLQVYASALNARFCGCSNGSLGANPSISLLVKNPGMKLHWKLMMGNWICNLIGQTLYWSA